MAGLTVASLRRAIGAILAALETGHEALTALDARIGDGDLGITLLKAFRELDRIAPDLPEDLGQALMQAGAGVARVSSSSFGTLMATGLMAAGKAARGRTTLEWDALPALLDTARAAMQARGKAEPGDKTVLDALEAAGKAAAGHADPDAMLAAARAGISDALAAFRDRPNRVGRARIFGDRTIGIDDPGMVALGFMADALARPA